MKYSIKKYMIFTGILATISMSGVVIFCYVIDNTDFAMYWLGFTIWIWLMGMIIKDKWMIKKQIVE